MKWRFTLWVTPLFLFSLPIVAESNFRLKFSTEISENAVNTADDEESDFNTQGLLNFRYLWSASNDHWALDLQLVSELNYTAEPIQSFGLHSAPHYRNLSRGIWTLDDGTNQSLIALIDRAQLTYKNASFRASLGRFPNSWGRGFVFHPLDVFNAFPLTLVDREFKQGSDSLLVEYAFQTGSEIQVLTTVRPQWNETHKPSDTKAIKYSLPIGDAELETTGAIHYGDYIFGISTALPIADVVLRADAVLTCPDQVDCFTSGVVNVDYTLNFLQSPIYIFGEYFYNDVGVSDLSAGVSTLSNTLTQRIDRGDLFSLGKNLLAVGTHISWHPLWNQTITVLTNMNDKSTLLQTYFSFAPTDHANLNVGIRMPFGDTNEEFGELIVNDDLLVGGVASVFAEFIYYR